MWHNKKFRWNTNVLSELHNALEIYPDDLDFYATNRVIINNFKNLSMEPNHFVPVYSIRSKFKSKRNLYNSLKYQCK